MTGTEVETVVASDLATGDVIQFPAPIGVVRGTVTRVYPSHTIYGPTYIEWTRDDGEHKTSKVGRFVTVIR